MPVGLRDSNFLTVFRVLSGLSLLISYVLYVNLSPPFLTFVYHVSTIIGANVFAYLTIKTGPGFVRDHYGQGAQEQNKEIPVCASCNNIQPMRSVHCHHCGTCVLRMDHHNPMLGTCIGAENLIYYIGVLGCLGFGLSSMSTWYFSFFMNKTLPPPRPLLLAILFIVHTILATDIMFIFLSTLFKMFVNITSFELKNPCSYMIRKPRLFNPFDRGMENNGPECYRGYINEKKLWTSLVYSKVAPENGQEAHVHGGDACCNHRHSV